MTDEILIKRAETKGGKYRIDLLKCGNTFDINEYTNNRFDGLHSLDPNTNEFTAIKEFERLVNSYKQIDGINLIIVK